MTNSYLEMLTYIDNIIDIHLTASFTLTIWLVWKGASQLWKTILG
jgi:hypothetical protein